MRTTYIHFAKTGILVNAFHATDLFLYLLKKSGYFCFSIVFMGYRKRPVA